MLKPTTAGVLAACLMTTTASAQDRSPLRDRHVWLPMTGCTPEQMNEAVQAGYDTVLFKVHPKLSPGRRGIASDPHAGLVAAAKSRGMKLVIAILGWHGLSPSDFWDTQDDGSKLAGQLDPFWPEAMVEFERYVALVIDHYVTDPSVVAFAPTWGIYGEAGFTSFTAGQSPHALARFNEWLTGQGLPTVQQLPSKKSGPNTDWNRFVRFRYLYLQTAFDAMIHRLKPRAGGRPVGMWQEMYPAIGHLWTMVRVPSADFALYESCFPFQSNHDPQRTLAEAMGFRYRCDSADRFRDYLLPLLARKRGEGQRFMGCQLTNNYAVQQYGWSSEKAVSVGFDRWEDEFSPALRRLMSEPLESPPRDVLLVFPTYAAAALTDHPRHSVDAMSLDVILRQYGCQMQRIGSPRLDELTVAEMDAYRLIVVPAAAYVMSDTLERLERTRATLLFTGCFAQSCNGEYVPFGSSRTVRGTKLAYEMRPGGSIEVAGFHALTRGLGENLRQYRVRLPEGEGFRFESTEGTTTTLLTCGAAPLLSTTRKGRTVLLHGQFFADLCYDPDRRPPANLGGSSDASANEIDLWGPYSSSHPQQAFGLALAGNILDHAGVKYRVPHPSPRICAPLLGDHLEAAGVSANIAYNNTGQTYPLELRVPFAPVDIPARREGEWHYATVPIPPFSYVAIQPVRCGASRPTATDGPGPAPP